jgi:FAD:protein FMN transferase
MDVVTRWDAELGAWAAASRPAPAAAAAAAAAAAGGDSPALPDFGEQLPVNQLPVFATEFLTSVEQSAMACSFEVLLNRGEYPRGVELARDALELVQAIENELSVYRPTSDFSHINRWGSERAVGVRADVLCVLRLALDLHAATGGAFDITAGSLSELWGFSRREGKRPGDAEIAAALQAVGSQWVEMDQPARTVRLARPGVRLNPGGIGKGYALDRVASQLVRQGIGNFLLHGGLSSLAARGSRCDGSGESGWWIALAHPLRWEEKLGRLRLRNQALGTSGAGKQFFHFQGVRYSHVIDPRSGWPAQGLLSATVCCRSAAVADALATALFVMGPDAAQEFCQRHPAISAILVSAEEGSSRLRIDRIGIADSDWEPLRPL